MDWVLPLLWAATPWVPTIGASETATTSVIRAGPFGVGLEPRDDGQGRLWLGPESVAVAFGPGRADGFVGLVHGWLMLEDATVEVALVHGTLAAEEATAVLRVTEDGWMDLVLLGGALKFQGDGSGAGVLAAGARLRSGPEGRYAAAEPSGAAPASMQPASLKRLAIRVERSQTKRSLKLRAWEQKQVRLREPSAYRRSSRSIRQGAALRAKVAVGAVWSCGFIQQIRALGLTIDPDRERLHRDQCERHAPSSK